MSDAMVPGSVSAMAHLAGTSVAQAFLEVELVAIVDVSGSMGTHDSRDGCSRYEVACEEFTRLQAECPGRVALVAFAGNVRFVPGGVPPLLGGGTNLSEALRFARKADGSGVRFCVVSDGWPDDAEGALAVARTFESPISTIYVGPESDIAGREFLEQLAKTAGGIYQPDHCVALLAQKLRPLVGAGVPT
jgi:hypothetical protein